MNQQTNKLTESRFIVSGMTCGSCVRHVTEAISKLPGVSDVDVQLESGSALVRYDPEFVSSSALTQAIEGRGYSATEQQ